MANIVSRLRQSIEMWSFRYNCYEAVHPWTPHCSDSALEVGLTVFQGAIKLYTPLYLFSQLIIQRRIDGQAFKATSQSILRSTTFISANAFFALLFFCSSQYLTGNKFYYHAVAYLPAFIGSSMAVMIEKPSRRSSLAFYVANVASETLFRIQVGRGRIKPIPYGQVYLFTAAISVIMMMAKENGFEDDPLSSIIKIVVGPEEASRRRARHKKRPKLIGIDISVTEEKLLSSIATTNSDRQLDHNFKQSSDDHQTSKLLKAMAWLRQVFSARHRLCPHPSSSCISYTTKAFFRGLFLGYSTQLVLKLATNARKLLTKPELAFDIATDATILQLGLFLGTFSSLYKGTNCALRWTRNVSDSRNCFIAGLISGPSAAIYPSPTVGLYVVWKCLEGIFHESIRKGWLKHSDLFIVVLYGMATSQLFYSAMLDPKYMKKSYMGFLHRISDNRLHLVNRSVLDIFGTNASAGYEDFVPDLHPKYMSDAYLGSVWLWMIEQKFKRDSVS